MDGLRSKLGADAVPESALRVGVDRPEGRRAAPRRAVKSVAISIVFIMAYIAFRFDLRFAPGGVVALVHDALGAVGVLILLGKEIKLTTIAALLTIVGYSMNDTVVVYDRIRENLGKLRGKSFAQLINISISEMLGRTILTTGTVVFSLLAFFVWGTGDAQGLRARADRRHRARHVLVDLRRAAAHRGADRTKTDTPSDHAAVDLGRDKRSDRRPGRAKHRRVFALYGQRHTRHVRRDDHLRRRQASRLRSTALPRWS